MAGMPTMPPTPPTDPRPKIVLATFGTDGDLHPFIALALALKAQGMAPVLAAAGHYRDKVEAAGIGFAPMRPEMDDVAARLGMDEQQIARAVAARPEFLLQEILLPSLRESLADVMAVTGDAVAVVTHSAAYGAKLAAEQRGLPDFGVVLQPMMFTSIHDPPTIAAIPRLSRWIYRGGPRLSGAFLGLGKRVARRWARPIDRLRRELGLPPAAAHPLFEGQFAREGAIALFSPLFGAPQPDHPPHTAIVGFAFHDSDGSTRLPDAVQAFLEAGPPPLVFTQGTSAVHDAEDFMRESLAAVRLLEARAIFVLDDERARRWAAQAQDTVLITGYAPYSRLFPHASVLIHHGGVGTTAQALRAGRPQLIVPYLVDQPDNADRVVRLGAGRTLTRRQWQASRIADALRELRDEPRYRDRASEIGVQVAAEDGAAAAARIIVDRLSHLQRIPASR